MKKEELDIQKALEQAVGKRSTKMLPKIIEVLDKILVQGAVPKDALGFSDTMLEGMYGQAYRLYNTGKYKDGMQIFRLLTMLNPTEPKYMMGLAASSHMLKEYQSASYLYGLCGALDPNNPIPFFHASDCYLQMNDKPSALVALSTAIERSVDKAEYKTLKERATITVKQLKDELGLKEKIKEKPSGGTK